MKKLLKILLLSLRIFIILVIVGVLLPYVIDRILEILPFKNTTDTPKGNSTFVMSYQILKNGLAYNFKKIAFYYFELYRL